MARRIAYLRRGRNGAGAGIVWLGGFNSNMRGEKASHIDRCAVAARRPYLRFDYSGHGELEGRFETGAMGIWPRKSRLLPQID